MSMSGRLYVQKTGLVRRSVIGLESAHLLFPPNTMSAVVATRVKEMLSKMDLRCGGDFVEALDKAVEDMIKKAAGRCKENKRQTVYGCDC